MQFSGIAFDEEGIISFREEDRFCHNPFLVALQAVIGEYVLNDYYGKEGMLIPRYFCLEDLEDPTQSSLPQGDGMADCPCRFKRRRLSVGL